jgi:hypothetical protein
MFLIAVLLLMGGCGNEFDRSRPHVEGVATKNIPNTSALSEQKYYGNKPLVDHQSVIESVKIKAANEKEIALINKERDITLEKIKQETHLQKADIDKAVAFKKSDAEVVIMEHSVSVQKIYVVLIAVAMFFTIVFAFYFLQKRRKDRLKMHEDILQKEMYLKDRELQAKMAERILDTLEKGKLAPDQAAKLVDTLTKNTMIAPSTQIEHKNIDMEITHD